jgi:hypothetical protein
MDDGSILILFIFVVVFGTAFIWWGATSPNVSKHTRNVCRFVIFTSWPLGLVLGIKEGIDEAIEEQRKSLDD